MELQIEQVDVLLLIAAVVAIVGCRLRVPYVVALVVAGSVYNKPDLVYVLVVPAL